MDLGKPPDDLGPLFPDPPPPDVDHDAIRYLEDPLHGPAMPRTLRCLIACPHGADNVLGRAVDAACVWLCRHDFYTAAQRLWMLTGRWE